MTSHILLRAAVSVTLGVSFISLLAFTPLRRAAKPLTGPSAASTASPRAADGEKKPQKKNSRPAHLSVLSRAHLSRLWLHAPNAGTEDVFNGFYGYDYQRLEVVFLSVTAIAAKPGSYAVTGKTRLYAEVAPFRGTISLHNVQPLPATIEVADGSHPTWPAYCATGSFILRYTTAGSGLGGQYIGRVALDFQVNPATGRAVLAYSTTNPVTRRGGLLFEGQWRQSPTAPADEAVAVLWKQGPAVTHQILTHFSLGGRGPEIVNLRYAKVGWDTFWENEEWWVPSRRMAKR